MRKNDRIWGLEEFSIQKPITRNYTYEYLFHKFLEEAGLLSLKYFFVNLNFNDENRGLYAVEESFSKELLERQKKRKRLSNVNYNYGILQNLFTHLINLDLN